MKRFARRHLSSVFALSLLLGMTGRADAGLVIGSTVHTDSVYGDPIPFGSIFFRFSNAPLSDTEVEFRENDQVAINGNQDLTVITADLTQNTITIAFEAFDGGFSFPFDAWKFKFDNLSVADGAQITGLTQLGDDGVTVSSTNTTADSISINVQGYSGPTGLQLAMDSVTYQINFSSSSVPEPSSIVLFGLGGLSVLGMRLLRSRPVAC
jgi:PEP-CTERM motif